MLPGQVRPIATCVFRDHGRIFVGQHYDPTKGEKFYRPLGGAIEFGEHSQDSIIREIQEEMEAEIGDLSHVGTIENIFTFDDKPGHEIVLVYEARFLEPDLYEVESVRCRDDDADFVAQWKRVDDFRAGEAILCPEGLLELLNEGTP